MSPMTRETNPELGPIRPPSESTSLLLRVTRNCPWNRCAFCTVYKGHKFSRRSEEEVMADIDLMKASADRVMEKAGLGKDGDPANLSWETCARILHSPDASETDKCDLGRIDHPVHQVRTAIAEAGHGDGRLRHLGAAEPTPSGSAHEIPQPGHQVLQRPVGRIEQGGRDQASS